MQTMFILCCLVPAVLDGRRIHWENPWAGLSLVRWHKAPHVSPSALCGGCNSLQTSVSPSTGTSAPQTGTTTTQAEWNLDSRRNIQKIIFNTFLPAEAAPPKPHRSWWPPEAERAICGEWRLRSQRWRRWRCRSRRNWRGRGFSLLAPGAGFHMCCVEQVRYDYQMVYVFPLF